MYSLKYLKNSSYEIVTIFDGLQILNLSDCNYFSSRKINLI
jgi:hypothetical protein